MDVTAMINGDNRVRLPHDRDMGRVTGVGRVHEPDPDAVARLKEFWQKETAAQEETAERKKLAAAVARAKERKESKTAKEVKPVEKSARRDEAVSSVKKRKVRKLSDESARKLHGRYMAGETAVNLAKEAGCTDSSLHTRWRSLGLPRKHGTVTKVEKAAPEPVVVDVESVTAVVGDELVTDWDSMRVVGVDKPVTDGDLLQALGLLLGSGRVSGRVQINLEMEVIL